MQNGYKKCKECGDKVSTKAKVCPHCGSKVSQPTSAFTGLIATLLCLIVLAGVFSDNDQRGVISQEGAAATAIMASMPAHTVVSDTSLAPKDGRRVEVHSTNPELTKPECSMLINHYRSTAGAEGQVSAHKPSPQSNMTPWCVENLDGKGVLFNDNLFYTL